LVASGERRPGVEGRSDFNDVGAFFGSGLAEANSSAVTLAFLAAWANQ
jgi:adenosylhomocysteine nucleosidase